MLFSWLTTATAAGLPVAATTTVTTALTFVAFPKISVATATAAAILPLALRLAALSAWTGLSAPALATTLISCIGLSGTARRAVGP